MTRADDGWSDGDWSDADAVPRPTARRAAVPTVREPGGGGRPRPSRQRGPAQVEYERFRRPSKRGSRVVVVVLSMFVAIALIAGGTLVWAMGKINPGDRGAQIASLTIPSGSGVDAIGELLEAKGVISSATVFGWYVRIQGAGSGWKAGEYTTFHRNSAMSEVVDVLDAGPVPPQSSSLTLLPGTRLEDQLATINKVFPDLSVESLKLTLVSGRITSKYHPSATASWEGFLAPDTYQFEKKATAEKVLQTLVDQQTDLLDELGYDKAVALTGHSATELLAVASLIEKETGTADGEREKIARVIFNRLNKNIKLGIDAAILYGLGRTKGALTKSDLAKDTPYNNRLHNGLPPTPISAPSKESLSAAINPANGPWIYYVLVENNPSRHLFTDSAKEFERAKADAKARGVF